MVILDSNIIIYSTKPKYPSLRRLLAQESICVSVISLVEVMGFHKITVSDKSELEAFFNVTQTLPMSNEIADTAIRLKQARKMSLGDSLIAAILNNFALVTNNTKDFQWIDSLTIINPFDEQ